MEDQGRHHAEGTSVRGYLTHRPHHPRGTRFRDHRRTEILGRCHLGQDVVWGATDRLAVIEQLNYLLFIKWLTELHTLIERKPARTGNQCEAPGFSKRQAYLR